MVKNIEVIGKMNCYKDKWNYINKKDNPSFSGLILSENKPHQFFSGMEQTIYYIVSRPFYARIDERFFCYGGLKCKRNHYKST